MKRQDCLLLIKLISCDKRDWSQRQLGEQLHISQSEISQCFMRLRRAYLVVDECRPMLRNAREFLIYGAKYCFPTELGALTRGIATGYAAPVYEGKLVLGDDLIPVWPSWNGTHKGLAVEPLHPSVTKMKLSGKMYDILALLDGLRIGRAREREVAIEMLKEIVDYD